MPLGVSVTLPNAAVTGGSVNVADVASSAMSPGAVVTAATTKAAWAIQSGETIFVNERQSTGPSAWVAYKAAYVFTDGNAALVKEPDCVTYTGPMLVATNLRRIGEVYSDT